jgi:hypothetical protein
MYDKNEKTPLLTFRIRIFSNQQHINFCNWDASHRFALINDFLNRKKRKLFLKARVILCTLNYDSISKIERVFHSFIVEKNTYNLDFFRKEKATLYIVSNRVFKQRHLKNSYLSLINVKDCLVVFFYKSKKGDKLAKKLDGNDIQRFFPVLIPNMKC